MGKNGKSTKSPFFNFLINKRILFSVLPLAAPLEELRLRRERGRRGARP
eukprot:COSAG04_NODE_805_length_10154_cov_9.105122_18_plen_48_part_01